MSAFQNTAEGCRRLPVPLWDGRLLVDFRGWEFNGANADDETVYPDESDPEPAVVVLEEEQPRKAKFHPVRVGRGRRGGCQRICSRYRSRREEGIMVG